MASLLEWDLGDTAVSGSLFVSRYYPYSSGPVPFNICFTATLAPGCSQTSCDTIVIDPFAVVGGGLYEGAYFTGGPGDPLPNIKVNLEDQNGTILQTDITDLNGLYLFDQLHFGKYVIRIDDPSINHNGKLIELTPTTSTLNIDITVNSDGSTNTIPALEFNKFELMPNPANDLITLELAVTNLLDAEIELMDVNGQRNWSRQISLSEGEHSVHIDLTGIPGGVYFVVIKSNGSLVTKRFVKY